MRIVYVWGKVGATSGRFKPPVVIDLKAAFKMILFYGVYTVTELSIQRQQEV